MTQYKIYWVLHREHIAAAAAPHPWQAAQPHLYDFLILCHFWIPLVQVSPPVLHLDICSTRIMMVHC